MTDSPEAFKALRRRFDVLLFVRKEEKEDDTEKEVCFRRLFNEEQRVVPPPTAFDDDLCANILKESLKTHRHFSCVNDGDLVR